MRNTGLSARGKHLLAGLDGISLALNRKKHRITGKTPAFPTPTGHSSDVLAPIDDPHTLHVLDPVSEESDATDAEELKAEDRHVQTIYDARKRKRKRKRKHSTGENHGYRATLCPPYFRKVCLLQDPPGEQQESEV